MLDRLHIIADQKGWSEGTLFLVLVQVLENEMIDDQLDLIIEKIEDSL